ncbi:Altered inheritance of mitochondria protein 24, mitochondrial [Colletotrichum tanaceti]|uniref:Altered inheritance of mitochondria protein 24, mitochondrial n=1 Tax=Colletotrichum tanaceti TaxID=1306861 RepID=A0A4U6XHQ3_9PEZI|nr:Altered inheritance of mitochondria protein 24, mitochondrial [Colletotrichum tanaceti]TKW55073.1 Altered inheritance of mitochondria protein 24, mitochondrial [Colletotrichum tanaceti]
MFAMRAQLPLLRPTRGVRLGQTPSYVCRKCRGIQISAAPTTEAPRVGGDAFGVRGASRDAADARFEVLGFPYSLLSVTLSPSQQLYTRRGTLVGVAGKAENAQSTLSILSPFTRAFLGVPFLYQRISSSTSVTALISTKSPTTTLSVLHLDGTTDYMVAQRNALLAWTGHTLSVSPRISRGLSLAHWGSTHLTGRGLVALSSPGQVYEVTVAEGEEFVAHPSHVVAYSVSRNPPLPMRLKSNVLRFQIPSISRLLPETNFIKAMRDTSTYKNLSRWLFALRTSLRRTIWGDRLFLQFRGPTTLLMSSRGVRVADSLSDREVNEIADAPAGVVPEAVELTTKPSIEATKPAYTEQPPSAIHVANVARDGKVSFEDAKDLKEFVR